MAHTSKIPAAPLLSPALAALESAPFDDEEISDEEEVKAAEARAYVRAGGELIPHERVRASGR
jgi:hypothetical protein